MVLEKGAWAFLANGEVGTLTIDNVGTPPPLPKGMTQKYLGKFTFRVSVTGTIDLGVNPHHSVGPIVDGLWDELRQRITFSFLRHEFVPAIWLNFTGYRMSLKPLQKKGQVSSIVQIFRSFESVLSGQFSLVYLGLVPPDLPGGGCQHGCPLHGDPQTEFPWVASLWKP
jgi:hypothetical protein